jgi:hypothetical protein
LAPYKAAIPGLDKLIEKMAGKADGWTQSLLMSVDRLPDIPQLLMSSGLARQYLYKDRSTMNAALGLVYEDFSAVVREVDVPTHIIWGEHDNVAPIRTGIVLAGLLPNAELHVIRDSGHVPMTDNFVDFMTELKHSLENAPYARQAQKRLMKVEKEKMAQENVNCNNQNNLVYTGRYRVIRMHNCRGIVLRDVVAESIELVGSEVSLENVRLNSPHTGLSATNSVVTATLLQVNSDVGMVVGSSYLDLAGAGFVTRSGLIDVRNDSQLYFSLSESRHGTQIDNLHGASLGPVFKLR